MEKLDRLVWAAGLSIHAFGRRVGIRTNDPGVLDRVRDLLPPGWEPCFSPLVEHLFSLRVGTVVPGTRARREAVRSHQASAAARTTSTVKAISQRGDLRINRARGVNGASRSAPGLNCPCRLYTPAVRWRSSHW